jgi:hypothetical protein
MRGKWFAAGLVAAAGIVVWAVPSRAGDGDTLRLNMTGDTPTQNLVDDGSGAETIKTWHRGFGGFGGFRGFGGFGGFRPGFVGFRPGFVGFRPGFGGFRPGFGGFGFRPFYGGFYRPYYGGFGLGGFGYGGFGYGGLGYYGLGGYGYGYPGYYGGFYGPCAGVSGTVYTLSLPAGITVSPSYSLPPAGSVTPSTPAPTMPRDDGTYPYDGGPKNPVPMPKEAPAPSGSPGGTPTKVLPRSVPLEGRSVSLPRPATQWTYPAYGEQARRTSVAEDRTLLTKGTR